MLPAPSSPASRYDELHAEAAEALGFAGNTLRTIRDRYRSAYLEDLARWEGVRDDLAAHEHEVGDSTSDDQEAASAAEVGAADLRLRMLRVDADRTRGDLALHETELSRLELAIRNIEGTWLFMERGDASLIGSEELPSLPSELRMRIVEAQEAERARLAQEVHDGPAQALSNAIFQVEFIDRVFESDPPMARAELRFLRELLRRELGDVRSFIGSLRPPVLVELGLDGSIVDTVTTQAALSGLHITTELDGTGRRARRGDPDGGAARGTGSAAECPQARRCCECGDHHGARGRTMGAGGPRRRSRLRHRSGGRPWPSQLRAPVHAGAGRAGRRAV